MRIMELNNDPPVNYKNSQSPSPPASPPSLMHSTSLSNESTSPPMPSTPPSRGRPRYGELGHSGHVPLHRRGTENRYENFEDLLREAGYRETRIITPETQRTSTDNEPPQVNNNNSKGSVRGGVGAVVDFFSNFVPTSAAPSRSSSQAGRPRPSASPLIRQSSAETDSMGSSSSLLSTSSLASDPTPRATPQRRRIADMVKSHSTPQANSRPSAEHAAGPYHSSRRPIHSGHSRVTSPHRVDSQPYPSRHRAPGSPLRPQPSQSRASAYLRHIASVPSIPHSPSPSQRRALPMYVTNDTEVDGTQRRGNGEGEEEAPPPLPKSWLETVARAVLYGGHVGKPASSSEHPHARDLSVSQESLDESSNARSSLTDQTNALRNPTSNCAPPNLLARVNSTKSRRSESVISRTRVVCRSAPVSRNGSRVRGASGGDGSRERHYGRAARQSQQRHRGRKAKRDETFMPSLAKTKAEGDDWLRRGRPGFISPDSGVSFWTPLQSGNSQMSDNTVFSDGHHSASSDDEDLGEPDLARILVPPKRQNSIRSLRRHLGVSGLSGSAPSGAPQAGMLRGLTKRRLGSELVGGSLRRRLQEDDTDEQSHDANGSESRAWGKRHRGSVDDNDEDTQADYLTFLSGAGSVRQQNKRKSIPPSWSGLGTDE